MTLILISLYSRLTLSLLGSHNNSVRKKGKANIFISVISSVNKYLVNK